MDRRGFLKRLLGGSAAVALAPLVPRSWTALPPPTPFPPLILDARYSHPATSDHTHSGAIAHWATTGMSPGHTHSAPSHQR